MTQTIRFYESDSQNTQLSNDAQNKNTITDIFILFQSVNKSKNSQFRKRFSINYLFGKINL